ncbi:putative metabolite transport protein GIT1 [Candida viswanathii]|uniref:Putative metabolite transport protein GIT1 n=1 Tax=Candida viswanathii TaxID=5486 RepID=A0A367YRY6_9ASCO|nr:putative metabolite transport protein GIT1 [Candida viswanathii]
MSEPVSKTHEVIETTEVPNKKHFKYDAEERRQRLAGGAKLKDIMMIFCAGFALISDGYQNNVMSMLNKVFGIEYPEEYDSNMSTQVSNASLVGTILGQVCFGLTVDYIGRKWSIVTATCFLVFGSALCAASHGLTVNGMFWMLTIFRGVTGFGIGAEYPSSSVTASEAANESVKKRGRAFVLATNLPLSFGGPFALCIFLIVNRICGSHLDAIWRTMFAIGCFWPLSVFYFRLKMVTSELYTKSAIKEVAPYWLAIKYYWPRMIGTCVAWFLYDFVTFPNGIFSAGIISNVIAPLESKNLERIAEWNLLLGTIALPGVFLGALVIDKIGRKYTCMIGFCGYIVFGLVVGCAYEQIKPITGLFIVFYGLMMSSGNFGPGNVMGTISSESYATPIRGTMYGLSAAIGKVGAVVGTKTFTPIQNNLGDRWTFIIAAICGLAGVLVTFIFVPHLREEDLMQEDVKFKNYLIDNGWTGKFGLDNYDPERDMEGYSQESSSEAEFIKEDGGDIIKEEEFHARDTK